MLSFSVVGCGAAGNKAVIDLMDVGYNPDKCYLINSTSKDIPQEYISKAIIFGADGNQLGGCGKERSIGREMLLGDLQSGKINVDMIPDDSDQAIVLVASTEGGSGSSAVPILAKYFHEVHGKNVICVFFFGFNDDVRGMKNSFELCRELSEEYTVIGISNEKFLDAANGNKFKAEKMANALFVDIIKILTGSIIVPSSQMMDDTDLYKSVTTPGYMVANTYEFKRPLMLEDYRKGLLRFLHSQGFVQPIKDPGSKRIAMIFDLPEADDNIDYRGEDLRNVYGEPFEFFTHMNDNATGYRVSFIVSGMKLPIEEIETIYNEYLERTQKVNKSRDNFFSKVTEFSGEMQDNGFDMMTPSKKSTTGAKSDFFKSFGASDSDATSDY